MLECRPLAPAERFRTDHDGLWRNGAMDLVYWVIDILELLIPLVVLGTEG